MEWNEIISVVLKTIITGIITFAIPYAFSMLRNKIDNDTVLKLLDIAEEVCCECVSAVDQTYVDNLKKQGLFDKDAQKEAFEMCKKQILVNLSDAAKSAVLAVNGDLDEWIAMQIESTIKYNKAR